LDIEFYYTAEPDEFCSFVDNKSNQRWTWYAVDKNSGIIPARYNGKRTDEVFLKPVALLSLIPIGMYFTDDWGHINDICLKTGTISEKIGDGRLNGKT
jgi:insertion element IS1 protein InsB